MKQDLTLRGTCKAACEELCKERPDLRLVRGFYHCPIWGTQQHWWCEDKDGSIVDPTLAQFPAPQIGSYEEFDGVCSCEECGTQFQEEDGISMGNGYVVCSNRCGMRLVGLA